MNKKDFVKLVDEKLKLIRTEYGLTQDKMAAILGISKKTLIEIEKNRKSLGWTGSVALASIFSDSTILRDAIGGDVSGIIIAIAFRDVDVDYPKTWGGKVWWRTKHLNHNTYDISTQKVVSNYETEIDYRIICNHTIKRMQRMGKCV